MPLLWLIWFVAMAVTVIIARPVILRSIAQSGVPEAIESQTEKQVATGYRAVQAAFVTLRGDIQLFPITQKRMGGDVYHDTLEALLAGPDQAAIAEGAVTYIASGTNLIGCSLSNRVLFINLSKTFLASTEIQRAFTQVETTALAVGGVKTIVLLVEGEPFSLEP